MRVALSLLFWAYLGLTLAVCWFIELVPWLISAPFDRRRRFAHWYSWTWANHFHAISPFWRVHVHGAEKIADDRAYVLVANHQSSLDILVMFALQKHFKWVAKHTLFFVPIFGWHLFMAGYVPIRRGDRHSRAAMLERCRKHLRMGSSIMMFPEGTRNELPGLSPFKRGAFALAVEAGVPVVPIVISGTRDCLPRNAWVTARESKMPIHLSVLDPVDPASVGGDSKLLMREVRERIAGELACLEATGEPGARAANPAEVDGSPVG